jgi:cyclophilin family peptidyl-prolyl cis-trans isomerase
MSKKTLSLALSTAILLVANGLYWIQAQRASHSAMTPPTQEALPSVDNQDLEKALEVDESGLSRLAAVIQTTRGRIKFKFYSKDAPRTVRREIELIRQGFYNGLTFHRVVQGFVVQGGDPTGTGTGGSGVKQPAEFNTRKHIAGTVAMARAADPHSADSQFYIALDTHPHLDQQYTVFGQVVEGIEVAQQIQVGDRMTTVTLE